MKFREIKTLAKFQNLQKLIRDNKMCDTKLHAMISNKMYISVLILFNLHLFNLHLILISPGPEVIYALVAHNM